MSRENRNSVCLQRPEQLLHLLRHHHIQGGQRLVQKQNIGPGYDINQHLHLIFHPVGIGLHQLVPVFRLNAHEIEIGVQRHGILYLSLMNIKKEFQEFSSRQKFRHGRRGEHIADIVRDHISAGCAFFQIKASAVCLHILVQAVKQRCLSGSVSSQQTIDFSALEGKIDIPQHFFRLKAFRQMVNDKIHVEPPPADADAAGRFFPAAPSVIVLLFVIVLLLY